MIDTAIDLIWQSGYSAVSVDGICRQAGVQKGSFYHFFPSKAELAIAAIEEHFQKSRPAFDAAFSASVPVLERFRNFTAMVEDFQRQAYEQYGRVCGCPFAVLGSEIAGNEETIRAKTDEIFNCRQGYLENALRDAAAEGLLPAGADIPGLAMEIASYIMGRMLMARIHNDLTMVQGLNDGVLRLLGLADVHAAAA